ncbi:HTH-type transcriptional regulator VirS [compost metagenome]
MKYRSQSGLANRIKRDLRRSPPDSWPETEGIASHLSMSPSTLRRRLADEGMTYQALRDAIRREMAVSWLGEVGLSFDEVSSRVGFADTSSFYKAFRKWTGVSPGAYRSLILDPYGS